MPIFRAGSVGPSLRRAVTARRAAGCRAKGERPLRQARTQALAQALRHRLTRPCGACRLPALGAQWDPPCTPSTGSSVCEAACLG